MSESGGVFIRQAPPAVYLGFRENPYEDIGAARGVGRGHTHPLADALGWCRSF